jgi:hypothetical protein
MSTNLKTVGIFAAGLAAGGIAVWLSPPDPPPMEGQPMMQGPPTGQPGHETPRIPEGVEPGEVPPDVVSEVPMALDGTPLEHPPLPEGQEIPAPIEPSGAMNSPVLLDEHIAAAPDNWAAIRERVEATPGQAALLGKVDAVLAAMPEDTERMPPLQQLVRFLVAEKLTVDELDAAGVEVDAVKAELEVLLRPPRGKVQGGHEKAQHKDGAGQAPDGSRPLDPKAPRDAVGG